MDISCTDADRSDGSGCVHNTVWDPLSGYSQFQNREIIQDSLVFLGWLLKARTYDTKAES